MSANESEGAAAARQATTRQLVDDLRVVVRDAEALLRATSGEAGEKMTEARARAEASLKQARERLKVAEEDAVRRSREVIDEAEDYVRHNPWHAVGMAAGAGLVLGLLLGRR
ncbi:MAG TPA: DUF883 family protein [Steroidobacteraceae bacterium]|nr:DUF883 family protein [Steroidobacteraceae bacterium]